MSGAIKGYVVRGKDKRGNVVTGDGITTTEAAVRAMRLLEWGHCSDVAIFRVLDDGREERLPSYEEALAEIERLRAIEALNVGAIDASLVRLGAVTGAIGSMPARGGHSSPQAHALADVRAFLRTATEAQADALRAFMSDPLAALEAAERRLLEAGGWVRIHGDPNRWSHPDGGNCSQADAVYSERLDLAARLAAKGGA